MAQATHASDGHGHTNYMMIFWWLLGLTIAELAVAAIPSDSFPHIIKVFLLVGLALGKAAMVAAYFMHLRFEKATLSVIAVTPLILCVFLLFMLFPDRMDTTHLPPVVTAPAAAPAHH